MVITKINPIIYTHSLKDSLHFYINETNWFVFDIDLGMNYIRLKSKFLNNFYLSIWEKKDFNELHKLCLNLYIENIEKNFQY